MISAGKNEIDITGLMSGSSLDGLDLVNVHFEYKTEPDFKILSWVITHAETAPFDPEFISLLRQGPMMSARELLSLDHKAGRTFGRMVQNFIEKNQIKPDLISSHGHTIFHNPSEGYTLQIGHPAEIVAITGLPVAGDFRNFDIALKGQGAPFAPVVDLYLFSEYDILVNLGGIMNASFMHPDKTLTAFDIAPCNQTLNYLASLAGSPYDDKGKMAATGKIHPELFEALSDWPFFKKGIPKSLDNTEIRHDFHAILDKYAIKLEDKLATAAELIACELRNAVKKYSSASDPTIFLTGGGAFNDFLVNQFSKKLPGAIIIVPDEVLISFKEGLLLALMGLLRITNQVNVLKSVTGSKSDQVAGALYQGIKKYI